jgi:ankyrin repeat protein
VWHHAVELGRIEALEALWNWAKDLGLHPEELLLDKVKVGLTALQISAKENHVGILQKLWVWAEEWQLNSNELKKIVLLTKDNDGFTALHCAKLNGIFEAFVTLLIWTMYLVLNAYEFLLV